MVIHVSLSLMVLFSVRPFFHVTLGLASELIITIFQNIKILILTFCHKEIICMFIVYRTSGNISLKKYLNNRLFELG